MEYSEFGAPNTQISEKRVSVSDAVDLKVIVFTPSVHTDQPAIVFVSGWVTQIGAWQEVLREMTRDFSVYYVETREKNSAHIRGKAGFGVQDLAGDIETLVLNLGLEKDRYILFGSSLGATVILDLAPRLNPQPLCLALVTPNAAFRIPLAWTVVVALFYPPFYGLLRPCILWYLRRFRMNVAADPAQYEKYRRSLAAADPRRLKMAVMQFRHYQIGPALERISVPVLLFGAAHDKLHEPGQLKRMAEALPCADLIDLETNKRTHSAEVVFLLHEYLSKLSGTRPAFSV